jgi:uncharacterized membrane protein
MAGAIPIIMRKWRRRTLSVPLPPDQLQYHPHGRLRPRPGPPADIGQAVNSCRRRVFCFPRPGTHVILLVGSIRLSHAGFAMLDRSDHFGRQVNARMNAAPAMAVITFAILAILPLGGRAAFGQCSYEVTAIVQGPPCWPGNNPTPLTPTAMNLHGEIVGWYNDCSITGKFHAFYWSPDAPDQLITLPTPPWAMSSFANDLNDDGIIAGSHRLPDGLTDVGFVYDIRANNGEYIYLPTKHGAGMSRATAINNAGVVAGARSISKSGINPFNAVIWRPFEDGAPVEDLGVMEGPNSWASDVNEFGQASGTTGIQFSNNTQGWILQDGKPSLLGPIPCGSSSGGAGINNAGTVATGGFLLPGCGDAGTQGALWDDGDWELLPLIAGASGGSALAINDHRQATGRVLFPGGIERATLWQHGEVHLLSDLVDDDLAAQFHQSRAINNTGQILVRASTRAVLLTPAKVPFADLNYDCIVDVFDLFILLQQWGPLPLAQGKHQGPFGVPSADLNGDGVVNVTDVLILFDNWG